MQQRSLKVGITLLIELFPLTYLADPIPEPDSILQGKPTCFGYEIDLFTF